VVGASSSSDIFYMVDVQPEEQKSGYCRGFLMHYNHPVNGWIETCLGKLPRLPCGGLMLPGGTYPTPVTGDMRDNSLDRGLCPI